MFQFSQTATDILEKPLDGWSENAGEETNSVLKTPEANLETMFQQSEIVEKHAEQYWSEHVVKRPFDTDEENFVFNDRTFTQRKTQLEQNIQQKGEIESTENLDPQERRKQLVELREKRILIIIEQAWADLSYLASHRAKIESEVSHLGVNASNQQDIELLKENAIKAQHLASRLIKFGFYTESAIILFKKYREQSPELAHLLGTGGNGRYDDTMFDMLQATQVAMGNDLRISGKNDRDYLTTFSELRDGIVGVDYERLSDVIAARVKQLEIELKEDKDSEAEKSEVNIANSASVSSDNVDVMSESGLVNSPSVAKMNDKETSVETAKAEEEDKLRPETFTFQDIAASRAVEIDKTAQEIDDAAGSESVQNLKEGRATVISKMMRDIFTGRKS